MTLSYDFDFNGLFDDGKYVAGICDLYTEGSYARFNTTHDIKCPAGPFRETIFGDEPVDLSGSACYDLITYEYPLIVDKETVLMKVYTC